jgi:hypothetical protein
MWLPDYTLPSGVCHYLPASDAPHWEKMVGNFVSLPSHSLGILCGISSIVFGIFYGKLWTTSEDFQVAWLTYARGLLQNSSPDKIPKNLKEMNYSCTSDL